jgi:tetratricopeptide (TPR) repeat protein
MVWLCAGAIARGIEPPARLFHEGIQSYLDGNYTNAAECFRGVAVQSHAAGAWYNLGNAEWRLGRAGPAVLAWERARWIDPFHEPARANLDFARKTSQLEHPELAWYEICSAWLPTPWWSWLAAGCFWGSATLLILPGALRWGRSDWHQGLASAGFALFLLVLPALAGVQTRSKLGVVLMSPTPLRLAPAEHAQNIGKLNAGEAVRREGRRGAYYYVHAANEIAGWVKSGEVGWIAEGW